MILAVAAPVHHYTEVAPTSSTGVEPVTVANYLGGAAILGLLAVMVAAGLSSAGMMPGATKPAKVANRSSHPAH